MKTTCVLFAKLYLEDSNANTQTRLNLDFFFKVIFVYWIWKPLFDLFYTAHRIRQLERSILKLRWMLLFWKRKQKQTSYLRNKLSLHDFSIYLSHKTFLIVCQILSLTRRMPQYTNLQRFHGADQTKKKKRESKLRY